MALQAAGQAPALAEVLEPVFHRYIRRYEQHSATRVKADEQGVTPIGPVMTTAKVQSESGSRFWSATLTCSGP